MSDETNNNNNTELLTPAEAFGDDWSDERMAEGADLLASAEQEQQQQTGVTKVIDLGDGPLEFTGENYDDIMQQVVMAQNERFQRLMFEKPTPQNIPAPRRYDPVPEPTTDQLGAVMLSFPKDPIGAQKQLMEWSFGKPFEVIREQLDKVEIAEQKQYGYDIGTDFVKRHLSYDHEGNLVNGDYFPCNENATRILNLLATEQLEESPQNFEYAYSKLRSVNALIPFPEGYFDSEETTTSQPVATAISGRDSYYPVGKDSGFDDDEFVRRAQSGQMTLEQIEAEARKRSFTNRGQY